MPQQTSAPTRKFELPALAPIHFSLTDGTDIPPPPDSPIEEAPPAKKVRTGSDETTPITESAQQANGTLNGMSEANGTPNGASEDTTRGRSSAAAPSSSPTSPKRPSSIRRFLSRKSLNQNYTNGTNSNISSEDLGLHRPESLSAFSTTTKASKRRSVSWFRRFMGGGQSGSDEEERKRISVVPEDVEKVNRGPPAPTLPELGQLRARVDDDAVSLGGAEIFKDIK